MIGFERGHGRRRGGPLLLGAAALVLSAALAAAALAASTNFTEASSSPETVGDAPVSLVAADLDGDLDQDLAVANQNTQDVTILRGGGGGNFSEFGSSPEAAGGGPRSIVAADFDGDTDADLAVVFGDPNDGNAGGVTILRNVGSGNFVTLGTAEAIVGVPFSLAAADFDGDTDPDLAVVNQPAGNVIILRNNGSGHFAPRATSPEAAGNNPVAVAAADLDGDDDQDLAVANLFSNDVTILRNTGSGNFVPRATSPELAGNLPRAIVATDLEGDGDLDLAVANLAGDVTILRNTGTGNFVEPASSPEPAPGGPIAIAAADFDGDLDPDLALANNSSHNVTILRNLGSANFGQPATSPEDAGFGPTAIVSADFDGDLDPDLAVTNFDGDNVTILRNR